MLLQAVGLVLYIVVGSMLLGRLVSNGEAPPDPPVGNKHPAAVTVTIYVVDGPTQYCLTSPDYAAVDTIMVKVDAVRETMRNLCCWVPGD